MRITRNYKQHAYLAVLVFILAAIFFVFFKSPYDSLYLYYDDATNQVLRFYQGMWESVRADGLLKLWDWSNFMGANYLASNTYYNLLSPFTFVIYFFDKEMISNLLIWISIFKLFLIGIVAYRIIGYYTDKKYIMIIGMMMLTFNGWVFSYAKYMFMWDSYLFMIMVIWGVERLLKKNQWFVLFFSTAMLGIVNYYFLYMFSFLTVIYFVFRYIYIYGVSFEHSKIIITFGIIYFLGICTSMIVFLPCILNTMGTSRLNAEQMSIFASFSQIFRFLTAFFSPPQIYGSYNGFLVAEFGAAGWNGGMAIYSLLLTPLLLPQLCRFKVKKFRTIFTLYIFLFTLVIFIPIYFLIQGSLESRWFIIFCIINTFMVCKVLDEGVNKQLLLITYLIMFMIPVSIGWIVASKGIQDMTILNDTVTSVYQILVGYGVVVLLILTGKERWIFLVLIVEIVFINPLQNEMISVKKAVYSLGHFDTIEAVEYVKNYKDGLYRIDIMPKSENENYPMLNALASYNKSGFSGYHSLYNFEMTEFIKGRFALDSSWYFHNQLYKTSLKNELASRFWIWMPNEEISAINPPIGYKMIQECSDGSRVYENQHPLPVIQFASHDMSYDNWRQYTKLQQDILLRENVVVKETIFSINNNLSELKLVGRYGRDELAYLDAKEGDIIYVDHGKISNSRKKYNLSNEYKEVLSMISMTDYSYLDIPANTQIDTLMIEGDIHEYDLYIEENYEEYIKNKSQFQNRIIKEEIIKNDYLSYNVNIPQPGYIKTSIPYDKGWSVLVDGKEIEFTKINDGFIGFLITEGEHFIEFKYTPKGLYLGGLISFLSIAGFSILSFRKAKQRNGKN